MPRQSRLAPVLVVFAVLLLAGCNGILGGGGPATTPDGDATGTVTPVPVPETPTVTDTPTPATNAGRTANVAAGLPPGITAAGITNATALRSAHRAGLANRSDSITARSIGDDALNFSVLVDENGSYVVCGPAGTGLLHHDGSTSYTRAYDVVNGSITNLTTSVTVATEASGVYRFLGMWLLTSVGWDAVSRIDCNDTTLVRLHRSRVAQDDRRDSTTVYVRPSGVVRAIIRRSDIPRHGGQPGEVRRISYHRIGTTTVSPLSWVPRETGGGTGPARNIETEMTDGTRDCPPTNSATRARSNGAGNSV